MWTEAGGGRTLGADEEALERRSRLGGGGSGAVAVVGGGGDRVQAGVGYEALQLGLERAEAARVRGLELGDRKSVV